MAQADYLTSAIRAFITGASAKPSTNPMPMPTLSPAWRGIPHGQSHSILTLSTWETASIT